MEYITLAKLDRDFNDINLIVNEIMLHFSGSDCLHSHDFYEISLVSQGSVYLDINGQKSDMVRGQLLLLRPGDVHYKKIYSNSRMVSMGFSSQVFSALLVYLGENFDPEIISRQTLPPMMVLPDCDILYFSRKLDDLYHQFVRKEAVADFELRIILLEFIARLIPHLLHTSLSSMPEWFSSIMREMEEPEMLIEGLPAMQRLSGKSQSCLCKAFDKYLHMSPSQYLNQLRIEYAAKLLTSTSKGVLTIAYECGYETPSYFYRRFRKVFNMSPLQYRRQYTPGVGGGRIQESLSMMPPRTSHSFHGIPVSF